MRFAFWRGLVWFAASLGCLAMAAGILAPVSLHQDRQVKVELASFCARFRPGEAASGSDVARRARRQDYRVEGPRAVEAGPAGGVATAVTIYQFSWIATRWSCTVRLQDGRVRTARFRGSSLAD